MKLLFIFVIIPTVFILIVSYLTGKNDFGAGPNEDERIKAIKQKSIVQSWSTILLFLFANFLFDVFNLHDERLADVPFVFPELFYLIILIISYFIFLIINHRKMSA